VAAFPFSYYKTLRDLFIEERKREAAALKKATQDDDVEDVDVDALVADRRKKGLAVESL